MSIWQPKFLFWIIFFVCLFSCEFLQFCYVFFIDFDGYYIVRDIFGFGKASENRISFEYVLVQF